MKLTRLILVKIAELGGATLDGFFPAKYPQAKIWRELLNVKSTHTFSKPTFSVILSRLRKEGFVERDSSENKAIWRITAKGKGFLRGERPEGPKKDGVTRIITFDIPERESKKRRWIREELLGLGYSCLQKSVWIGYAPLPKNFFEDLDLLTLREHIHIFSINAKGTLANNDPDT